MEVYIDDMVIKILKFEDHIDHLNVAFAIMRQYGMKLNLKKCTFGVKAGKFIGFMVNEQGIEANSDKIKAIINIRAPKTVREV